MMTTVLPGMTELLRVMTALRDPDYGCPWDLKQTNTSLIPYTIEEVYEVAEAIEQGEPLALRDELGDLLFQVVFYSQLAVEQQQFSFDEVAAQMAAKLIRRHPHVFHDDGTPLNVSGQAKTDAEIKEKWEQIKQQERLEKAARQTSAGTATTPATVFADIPRQLPAILAAQKLQKRAASVGFDWDTIAPVCAKVEEELAEVKVEIEANDHAALTDEIGDLLFAVVNLARHCQVNPETALQQTNAKFKRRFQAIEQNLAARGLTAEQLELDELEEEWQQVKKAE